MLERAVDGARIEPAVLPSARSSSHWHPVLVELSRPHAGQVLRAGESHGGLILFRRTVRSTNYGEPARLLTEFWAHEGHVWDWLDRIVYLPKSP